MTNFVSVTGILFCLHFVSFPCEGKISPPPFGDTFVVAPGTARVEIAWTFDDTITAFSARRWTFVTRNEILALIIGTGSAVKLNSSLLEFEIEKPATLVLKNVDDRYNGTYEFSIVDGINSYMSRVMVFVAGPFEVTTTPSKRTTGSPNTKDSAKDIDECKMKSLYNCTKGYDCVNTQGSYECVCKGIENRGECTKGFERHRVNLRLNEDYKPEYAVATSEEYQAIERRISNAMRKIYVNNENYITVDIDALRNGSVIADLNLAFKDTDESGVSALLAAVRNNSFGDFDVDPDALTVVKIGTCPSDECPKHSTCKQLTQRTISCPCDDNFYFDGVNCTENVVIEIEITLEKPFVEALNNVSSPEYIELKRNVTAELTEVFKDTPNFQEVQVLAFRNGSTIVDFKVIYRQDRVLNSKVVVAEAIKKQLKNNKIRNLALKFGTGVKLGGTPDPPTDLKQTDVTEDRIDISWGEPVGARFFQINGYIISYKTVSESQYKMVNVSAESSVKILVLSDLESDTFYTISVHAYNDDGDGDKVTIQVTTKDTDSPVVIIVVVVIVCVLLIILMVVIFIQLRRRRKRQLLRSPRPHPDRDVMKLTGFQPAFENKTPGDEEMIGSQAQNL